jgi:ribosomal protein L4
MKSPLYRGGGRVFGPIPHEDGFKLNNNYRAFYARLLACNEIELRTVFELRTQRWQSAEIN